MSSTLGGTRLVLSFVKSGQHRTLVAGMIAAAGGYEAAKCVAHLIQLGQFRVDATHGCLCLMLDRCATTFGRDMVRTAEVAMVAR
jgi:hypothetical protein